MDPVVLGFKNDTSELQSFPILKILAPPIQQKQWRLKGEVRYADVEGNAYLEMYSYFPEGSYFSRTLAPMGPLSWITGSSEWREFILPFDASQSQDPTPEKLEFNLVMPGKGWVELRSVALYDGLDPAFGGKPLGAWWRDGDGGYMGAFFGLTYGTLGTVIGSLSSKGKRRRTVFMLIHGSFAISAILLGVGVYAVMVKQPYAVFYPLLVTGGIGLGCFACIYPGIQNRYQQIELRQMQAQDAGH